MVATKTIEVPFDAGLSQKTDALWLAPGTSAAAQNLVKLKTGSMAKRPGFTALATAGQIPSNGIAAASTATLSAGKRLFSYNGALGIVARDAFTDAVWSYDDTGSTPLLLDRAPEVYCYPPTMLTGVAANPAASVPSARTIQTDTAVANGYEMHVWGVGDQTGIVSGADIYYELRNATTGAVVVPAQVLVRSGVHGGVDVPKVIAVQGFFVLTYSSAVGGDANIYARVFNTATPYGPWTAESRITVSNNDASFAGTTFVSAPYDTCVSLGETGFMALAYARNVIASPQPTLVRCSVAAGGVTVVSHSNISDGQFVADSTPQPWGFAVYADAGNGEIAYAYSYVTATPTTRVHFGAQTWPAFGAFCTTVDLLGTPGPISTGAINPALILSLARLGSIGGLTSAYKIVWSPGKTTMRQGDAASVYPFIASYIASPVAGIGTVAANQPRITWNAALASQYQFVTAYSTGYMVGYVPSDTQGSHFVLADDAAVDIVTANQSSGFARAYFPMRLVANLTPRQSSVANLNQVMMGLTGAQFSRVGVHLAVNNSFQGGTGIVLQPLLPRDNSPITSAPTLYPFDLLSQKSYAPSQLGQNAILAGGCPSAFDGTQAFELGFPHAPAFALSSGGVSGGTGTFSYIAIYQWVDGAGQVHRSARSVPTSTGAITNKTVTIVCAIPGFSARMKAPNASQASSGVGPQAGLPLRRNILVYLYRTTNGGNVYFQCHAPVPVTLDSPTVTITDDFTLSGDINLISQPLLYGDGSDGTGPGNILDDECPPAFQHAIVHNNRIYGVDGLNVWLSKEFTTFAGAGFNEATAFSVDDGPGNLTALGSLDGNLVLFKADRIFIMSGQGPADNGTDNDLTPPSRLASDVGCVDWRSVVQTKDGLYFQSAAGRRLLTRDLQVQPVPVVEDLDASFPVTTSAIVHPTLGRVLWSQNTDDLTSPRSGCLICNDYILQSWTEQVLAAGVGFVSAVVATAANGVQAGPNYFGLLASGQVWRENLVKPGLTAYQDPGAFVPATWTGPWLKSDGLVGWSQWEKIRLLLTVLDPAALTVQIAYDYATSPSQTFTRSSTEIAAKVALSGSQLLVEIMPANQRAASMQITIADSSDAGTSTGEGFILEDLRVDYGYEPGGYRTPTSMQG